MPRKSLTKKKERVLILDADSSVYAVGFMTQKKTHYLFDGEDVVWDGESKLKLNAWRKIHDPDKELRYDFTEKIEPVSHALASCKNFVANTLEFTGCSRTILLLTKGGNCFRHHRATIQKYKGNRDKLTKPVHYDAARKYYMDYYDCKMYSKYEADDVCCMIMHKGSGDEGVEYILAAIDKDLEQMPGKHVNPSKKDEGVYVLSEAEGWYNFYHQMLCGDTADNIKGLKGTRQAPGISADKAHKLLEEAVGNVPLMCHIVYDQYLIRYGNETFSYEPWWMDEKYQPNEFYGVKQQVLSGDAMSMFRENADLLYMLRTPTDQYQPHCKVLIDRWVSYPTGIVDHAIPAPKEKTDDSN